ncbi:MAG: ribonuclease HI [Desulfovibrio sp.]|jgi:ribonuclease HI|nr:ribonuclease HI [Desulfovibrio sp.]
MKKVVVYTDGACLGNPGPGGWGAVLLLPDFGARKELSGGFAVTTNNRMEIVAVLEGLAALREACEVSVHTDSRYVCDALEKGWLDSWRSKNWLKPDKKPVKNIDLWQKLVPLLARHKIRFHWLRGHAGHAENERCDDLARRAAASPHLPPDTGYGAGGKTA